MLAEKNGKLAIDTETVGQPVMAAKIVGFSVAVNADDAYYVPLAHKDDAPQLDIKEALAVIRAPLKIRPLSKSPTTANMTRMFLPITASTLPAWWKTLK